MMNTSITCARRLSCSAAGKALLLAAAFLATASTSRAQHAGSWRVTNLWAPKTFSHEVPAGRRVDVKVKATTLAWTNPLNRYCRLKVELLAANGAHLGSRVFQFRNSSTTKTLSVSARHSATKMQVRLTPMDNARFQGTVNMYNRR